MRGYQNKYINRKINEKSSDVGARIFRIKIEKFRRETKRIKQA